MGYALTGVWQVNLVDSAARTAGKKMRDHSTQRLMLHRPSGRGWIIAAVGSACLWSATPCSAESVYVKYRGTVDLAPFACEWIERSSLVKRLCFDAKEKYVVVNLSGTYYHYCEVPPGVVATWRSADSMGRFYNASVKGNFDCRILRVPAYRK